MESKFYDERINLVRGKAMRKTIFFCWLFTLCYLLASVLSDLLCGRFVFYGTLVALITAIGGGLILLFGELCYLGASRDERRAAEKALYYTRAFYGFVYLFAFAYCIHIAVNLRYEGLPNGVPYGFFPAALLEIGGLYLIYSLKQGRVMLNYSEIESEAGTYYGRVFGNILKFGGLCMAFTVFALCLFFLLGGDLMSLLCIGVLLGGLFTWLILSFEYFLLSLMERLSEKAQQQGRFSLTMLLSFLIALSMSLSLSYVGLCFNLFEEINAAATVILYNYLSHFLSRTGSLAFTFFIMYFCSEAAPLQSKSLQRAGNRFVVASIVSLCLSTLQMITAPILALDAPTMEEQLLRLKLANYTVFLVSLVFVLINLSCILSVWRVLQEKRLLPRLSIALPILYTAVYSVMRFLNVHLQRSLFNIVTFVMNACLLLFFTIYVIKWFKNIHFPAEE